MLPREQENCLNPYAYLLKSHQTLTAPSHKQHKTRNCTVRQKLFLTAEDNSLTFTSYDPKDISTTKADM